MAANENGTSQLRKVLAISSALLQDFLQYMRQAQTEYYHIADRIRHGSAGEFGLDIVDHPENYREIHNIDGSVDELKELFDECGVRYFEIGSNPQAKMASSFIISQEDYVRILNLGLIHERIGNRHTAAGDRDGMQAGPASDDEKIPGARQGIYYKDPLGRTDEEVEHDQNGQDIPEDTGDASLYEKHGDPDKVLADGRGNYFITDENGLQVLCDHDGCCLLADENDPGIFIDSLGNAVRVGDDGNRYLIGEDGTQILIGNDDMPVLAASQNSIYVSPDGVRFMITDEKWMILAGKDGNPLLVVRPDDSIEVDNLGNEIRYYDFNNRFLILDDERQLLVDENDEPILYDGGIGHSLDESIKKADESLKKETRSPKQDKTEEELALEHAVYTDAIKREREKKKREQLEYDALLKSENEKSEKLIRGNAPEKAGSQEAQNIKEDGENTRAPWDTAQDRTGVWERRRSEKHLPRTFEKAVETAVTEAAGAGIAESALAKSSLDKPPVQTEAVKVPDSFQDKKAHETGDAGLKVARDGLRKQNASTEEKTRRRQVITKREPEAASGKEPAGSQPSLDADGTAGYKGNPAENNSDIFTERGQQPATAHPQPDIDHSSQNDYKSQSPYSPGTGTGTGFLHADGKSGSVYRNTVGKPLNPDAVSVKEKDFPEETESPQASPSNALVPDGNTGSGRLATRSFHEEAVTGHTGALRSHLKCTEKAINADSVRNDDTELPVSLKRDVRKDADREHERAHKAETNNENVPAASADRFKKQAQEKEYEKQEADNAPDKDLPDKERELQKARAVKNAYMQSHQKNGSGARHASDEIFTGHGADEAGAGYNADRAAEYGSPAYDALKTGGTQKSGAFHMLESSSGQPVAELKQENKEEDRANTSTSAFSGDTVKCGREQHETESSGALRRHIKAGEGKETAVFADGTARENSGTLAHHEDNSEDQKNPVPGTREESRAPKVGADAFLKEKDSPANEAEPEEAAHSDAKRRRSEAVRNAYEQSHRISVHADEAAFHPEDDRSASGSGKAAAGLALDKTKGSPSSVTERAALHQPADEEAQGRFPERPGGKNPGKTDYTDTPDHRPGENDAAGSDSRVLAGHSFGARDITRNGSMPKTNPGTDAGQFLRNDDGENSREDTGTWQLRGEAGSRRAGDSVQDAAHKQEETGSSRSEDTKDSKDKVHPERKNDIRETGRTGHSSSRENDWETGNGQSSGVWMERRKSKNAYAAFQAGIASEEEPSKTPAIKPSVSDSPDLSEGLSRSRLTEAVKEENKDEKPVNPYLKQDDTAQSTDRKDKNPVPAGTDEKKGRVLRDKRRQAVTAFQRDKRRQENEEKRKQENVSLENTRQEEKRNLTFKSRTEALEATLDGMAGTGATIAGYQQQVNAERRELEKAVENEHLAGHGNNQPQDLPDQPYSGQEAGCTTPDGREQQESPEPSKGHMLSEEDKKKERIEKENAKKKANIAEENARQQEYIQRENERQQEFLSQENARQKGYIEQGNIRQRELGKKDSGFASNVFHESGINTPGYPADPGRQDGIAGQERSPESEFYGYSGRNTGYEIPAGHQDFSENDTAGRGSTISGYQQEVNAEKLELENAVRDEHLSGHGSSGAPGEYAYEEPARGAKADEQEKVNGTGSAPGQASSQDQPVSLNGPEVSNGSQTAGQNSAGYSDSQSSCLQAGSSYTDGRLEHEPCKQQETFRNFKAGQNTVIQESEVVLQDITVDPVITVPEEPARSSQIQDTFYEQTPAERSNETVPVSKDTHNTQNESSEPLHEREIFQNAPVNESAHNYPEGQAAGPVTDRQHPEDSLQNKPQSMYSGHSSEYARQPGNENVIDNTADTFSGKDVTHPAHENAHGGDSYAYPEESAQQSGMQDEKQQHSREFKQGQPFSQDADNTAGHNRYSESHYMNGQGDKGSVAGQANAGSALSGNTENTAGSDSSNITGARQPQGSQAYNTGQVAGRPGMQGASGGAAPFRFTESPVNRAAGQENAIRNDNSVDTSGSAQENSFNANGSASRTVYVSPGDPGSPAYSNEAVHSSPKDGLSAGMAGNEKPGSGHSIAPDNIRNPYQKNIVQTAQPQDEKAGGPGLAHHESGHRGQPVDTPVKQGVVQSPDAVSPGLNNGNGHTPANADKGISQKGTQASSHAMAGTGIVTGIKNAGFHTAGGPVAAMPRTESGSGGNVAPGGSHGTYGGIKKNSHSGVAGSGIKNNSAPAPSTKGDGPRGSAGTPTAPGYVHLPGQKISGQEHTIKDSGLKGGKAQGISAPATDSIKKGTAMPAGTGSGMGKPGSSSQNIPSGNERGQQHAGAARKPAGAASLDNVRAGLLKSRNMAGAFGPPRQNDKGRAPKGSGIKNRAPRIKSWKESELSSGTLRSHVNAIRQNGGKGAAYNVESSSFQKNGSGKDAKKTSNLTRALLRALDYKDSMGNNELRQGARRSAEAGEMLYLLTFAAGRFQKKAIEADKKELARILTADDRKVLEGIALDAGIKRNGNMGVFCLEKESGRENFSTVMAKAKVMRRDGDVFTRIGAKDMYDRGGLVQRGIGRIKNRGKKVTYHNTKEYSLAYLKQIARKQGIELSDAQASEMYSRFLKAGKTNEHLRQTIRGGKRAWKNMLGWHFNPIDNKMIRAQINGTDEATQQGLYAMKRSTSVTKTTLQLSSTARANLLAKKTRKLTKKYEKLKAYRGGRPNDIKSGLKYSHLTEGQLEKKLKKSLDKARKAQKKAEKWDRISEITRDPFKKQRLFRERLENKGREYGQKAAAKGAQAAKKGIKKANGQIKKLDPCLAKGADRLGIKKSYVGLKKTAKESARKAAVAKARARGVRAAYYNSRMKARLDILKSKLLGFPGKLAELQRILLQKLLVIGGQAIAGFLAFAMVFIIAVEIAFLLETAASFFTSPFDSDDSSDYGDEIDGYQGRLESGHLFEGIFYTSVYADEGGGETESDPPYKYTALRIVYNELLREEKLWAGNLKNVFTDAPRLEDLYYTDFTTDTNANDSSLQESVTDDHIDISLWASEHGYTYYPASDPFIFTDEDGNERSGYGIKGTQPFNNAPLAAYKWIKKMDGGVNVRFMGGTGQNLMTSNVQEIIAMAMVAQEQTDMGKEEDEADPASDGSGFYSSFADWVANFFTSVRNFFANLILGTDGTINNSIPREWFQDWWDKHMAYEESKAYMIYCKPLFDQSHREGFSIQMSLLPTRWTEGSVYSTYNTTIGYTYGNLETVDGTDRPAVSVENTVPEAEYNQLKATALSYGRVKIDYSDADLDMAARVVYHEAGPSDRAGAVAVAEVLYNQVLQAAYGNGKGYTTSIITNINKYFVPWFASGTWNPNSAVNKSIKEMCRNVFDGIEFVSGNTYMLSYAAYSDHSSPSTQGTFGADPVYACDYPAVSKQTFYRRVSDRGSNLPAPLGSYDTVIGMNVAGVTLDSAAEPGTTGADSITGNATGRTTEVAVCTGDDDGSADLADFESYGFGCMTYDRFFFKDHNSTDMYYGTDVDSSEKVPQVASESYVIYAKETGDLYESEVTPSEMNPADTENKSGTGTEGQGDAENKQVIIDASGTHFEVQNSVQVLVDADRNPIRYLSVVAAGEDGRKVRTDSNGHRLWIQENDDLWPEVAEEYGDDMPDPAIHYGYQVLVDQNNVPILVKDEFSKDESQTGTIENEDSIAPVDQNTQTIIMDKEIPEELRERYDHRFVCVAPNGKTELFLDAFENNDDCWIPEFTDETMVAETPEENDNQTSNDSAAMIAALGDFHSKIWQDPDKEDGYIYAQSEGDGEVYYIWIVTNSDKIIDREYEAGYEEGFDEEGNWYPAKEEVPEIHHYRHTLTKVTFTHHCAGNHRGYYCGGHLLVDTTGIIFHITEDERNNIENPGDPDNYVNKVTLGSDGVYRDSYGQSFSDSLVNEISDDAVDQDRIRGAKDLFDIDLALKHQRGGISESFQGWTASEIEEAASKLLDDWYALYGIYVQDSLAEDYGYSSQGSTFDDASGQSVHVDFSGIPERDYSSMVSALASSGGSNFSQYINTKTKITTITDVDSGESRQFFNEQQSYSAAWKNCRYPTNMISEGCFLYAAAAAVSNLKNEPYLVSDACAALSGQGWTFDESGNRFVINGSINSENLTVGGSITRLNKILQASGSGHHATSVLNSGAAWNSSLTQQVMQGKTALIYATQSAGSRSDLRSGSAHWTYIAGWFTGDDGTPWAIILCNGNRFNKIRFSDIGRLKYVYMID